MALPLVSMPFGASWPILAIFHFYKCVFWKVMYSYRNCFTLLFTAILICVMRYTVLKSKTAIIKSMIS